MPTLPCPRCGQPRTAHTECPACHAPGLETAVPPLPDVADEPFASPAPLPPSVRLDVPPQPSSDRFSRLLYFVAAALSAGALLLFHGVIWGGLDTGAPVEEVAAPPAPPDALPPPGVPSEEELARIEAEAERIGAEAEREAERIGAEAERQAEQMSAEAERQAEEAARQAEREAERAAREAERAARNR